MRCIHRFLMHEVQALEAAPRNGILARMATRENEFELKLGRIGQDRGVNLSRVRATVRQRSGKSSTSAALGPSKSGLRAHFRKGAPKARPTAANQRRVVVKARFAVHGGGRGAPLKAHVSYLGREGRSAERSEPGLERAVDYLQREETSGNAGLAFYDRGEEGVDGKAITAGWADDRLHFRLIVSPEDGEALGDLKPFIREVMAGLEQKLGTRLEWLAVDHWDTDNPHSHVLVRGKRADGQDLFIPSKILVHGIREHAQEVATRILGPRLEADLVRERFREISELGPTALDRQLVASQDVSGVIIPHRPDLIARLERLEGWGLAERGDEGGRISNDLLGKLKAMREHAEVERTVSGYLSEGRTLPVLAADRSEAIEGRLVHLGPGDEFGDGFLAVIETGSGELRYQRFEREADLAVLQDAIPGAMVAFEPNVPEARPSDHAIAQVAERTGGVYSLEHHLTAAPGDSRGLVEANIRRLEAMRRMSLVARTADGVFTVGENHLKRALMYEERIARRYPVSPSVLSYWTLEEQITAGGPTRLDRVLAGEAAPLVGEGGFARQLGLALQQRRLFLIEQGWLKPDEKALSPLVMKRMAENELRGLAVNVSAEIGMPVVAVPAGQVRGVYARRIDLAQGRVALIIGDRHASLVPWRPALEGFAGRQVEGVLRRQGLSWGLARAPGLGLR